MSKLCSFVVFMAVCWSSFAATPQYTNFAAFYFGDSFSQDYPWQSLVTNVPNLKFRWQFNEARNGNNIGHVVTNQWPDAKAMMAATNFGQKIAFVMIGVNPGPSYVDEPVYYVNGTNVPGVYPKGLLASATNFCLVWSNIVWEMHQSNMLVYAFTVTECGNRTAQANLYNWPEYYGFINNFILHSGLADFAQDNETLLPYDAPTFTYINPDTVHPTTLGYQTIATNVVQTLSAEPRQRTVYAARGAGGAIKGP